MTDTDPGAAGAVRPGVVLTGVMYRKPTMTALEFHDHWRTIHAPLGMKIPLKTAYVQAHATEWQPDDVPTDPSGGVAQLDFPDEDSIMKAVRHPDYLEGAGRDEDRLHDTSRFLGVVTRNAVATDALALEADHGAVKVYQLVSRRPALSEEQFRDAWLAVEPTDADAGRLGVLRHERGAVVKRIFDDPERSFDGVRELWFADTWSLRRTLRHARAEWDELVGGSAIDHSRSRFLVTSVSRFR